MKAILSCWFNPLFSELTTKIDQLEIELTAERNAREVAETKLEEVEFELAESQAGGENVARKNVDDEDEEGDDSNNDYLLGEIEDLKVILFGKLFIRKIDFPIESNEY